MKRTSTFTLCSIIGGVLIVPLLLPLLAQAVTVGPVHLELSANPGETVQGQMFLQNEDAKVQTFYPSLEVFTEVGGVKVFLKDTAGDLPTWIEITPSSTIPSGQSKIIPFTIRVPRGASPGGHYAVIWWSTAPPANDSGNSVAIATKAGVLLYLRVAGDIREEASVADFSAKNTFIFSLPFSARISFHNSGNVYVTPAGTVSLANILGGVQASVPLNPYDRVVLPNTDYAFDIALNPSGIAFGPYKVKLDVIYGAKQTHIIKSFWVFILPTWLLIFIAVLILLVFLIPKAIKRYNAWIVKKATGK